MLTEFRSSSSFGTMFNSAFQVLPTEIVAQIFEHALVANYAEAGMYNEFGGSKPVLPVDCGVKPVNTDHPHIVVSLLQVSRQIYHIVRPMLYKVKKLEFSGLGTELQQVIKPSILKCCKESLPVVKDLILRLDIVEDDYDGAFGMRAFAANIQSLASWGHLTICNLTIELVGRIWMQNFAPHHLAVALKDVTVLSRLTIHGYGFTDELHLAIIPMAMRMQPCPTEAGFRHLTWLAHPAGIIDYQSWDSHLTWREWCDEWYQQEMHRRREAQRQRMEEKADALSRRLGVIVRLYDLGSMDPDNGFGYFI